MAPRDSLEGLYVSRRSRSESICPHRHLSDEYVHSYEKPKTIRSRMNKNEPMTDYTIYYQPTTGAFRIHTPATIVRCAESGLNAARQSGCEASLNQDEKVSPDA
jgi:hypothetical protein